jgi:cytochrome c peroxidase
MYRYLLLIFTTLLYSDSLVAPIDDNITYDKQKASLGKILFFDTKLSKNNTVSCFSCHNIYTNGADDKSLSLGVEDKLGDRNSPTIFNARYNFVQFWDGRAKNLKEQVIHPIENPVEMANSKENLLKTLKNDKEYQKLFKEIYKDGITIDNISDAIAEFEMALVTKDSKFDRYLMGEKDILTDDEKEGFYLFKKKGCASCHNGKNFGGNMYQKFGVVIFYDDNTDLGRYSVTKKDRDKFLFKVPTLRNIALTAPYFHDGRTDSLKDAIKIMAKRQIGRTITDDEIDKIEKFLHTLTGKIPDILNEN